MTKEAVIQHTTGNAFEEIASHEQAEEKRVEEAMAKLSAQEQKAAQELQQKAKAEEEALGASVATELDSYKKEELAPLFEREKRATAEAAQALEAAARKKMPAVVETLLQKLLEPSFLSR
ncbi:MAG TPA: hypothetical protein VHA78_00915 [Candidatus Peribacteraceae bacterium]|nr:hypothetical protein [Candidatus Peribacteraceae bacterium]